MAFSKPCPICKQRIFRKEVKTCGGVDCVAQWRTLSSNQKAKLVESAGADAVSIVNISELTSAPIESERTDPVVNFNEIAKRIFDEGGDK